MCAKSLSNGRTAAARLGWTLAVALVSVSSTALALEKFKLVATDAQADDQFGVAVAIDADTVVIGASEKDEGVVYVFVRNQGGWEQQAKLTAPPDALLDFGASVSISGEYLIVGANNGRSYVFHRSGSTWSKQATLIPTAKPSGISAVAISGDDAAVVQPIINNAHVYKRSGATWTKQTELSIDCVSSVAISGNYLLVGCGGGPAHVFRRFLGIWAPQATFEGTGDGHFGYSVAINGNHALIGEPVPKQTNDAVYFYLKSGPAWTATKVLSPAMTGAAFGVSVSLDADRAIVGMPNKTPGMGAAFLYKLNGASWSMFQEVASNVKGDLFGVAVAVSGDRAVVGAPTDPMLSQGAAYVYEGLHSSLDFFENLLSQLQIPIIEVGCEIVDCCPGCPGPPFELDWRIRLNGAAVEAVTLWFPTLPSDAARRLSVKGNARWLGLNQLRVGRGETILSGFSVNPKLRSPVAVPSLVIDETAVRSLAAEKGGRGVGAVELTIEQLLGQVVVSDYSFVYDFDEALRSRSLDALPAGRRQDPTR